MPTGATHTIPLGVERGVTPAQMSSSPELCDLDNGTHTVPEFAYAVRRHEVIAAIENSAAIGKRVEAQPAAPIRACQ
jgi:hypothetical protein